MIKSSQMQKILLRQLLTVTLCAAAGSASAAISLEMSTLFGGNIASRFADASGVPTDTMNWGIVVDTGATTGVFSIGSYLPFNIATGGFLSTSAGVTDDYYYPASATTFNTSNNTESGGASGDHGTIGTITGVPYGNGTGIALNKQFGLIWFSAHSASAPGNKYGFFTDPALTIPSDGQDVVRSSPFVGDDPIRTADLTIVPEPGTFGFVFIGVLGFGLRRVRSRMPLSC